MQTAGEKRLSKGARGAPHAGRPAGDPRPAPRAPGAGRIELAVGVMLAAVAFALYARTGGFPFTNFDDLDYVVDNPHVAQGLTAGNLAWAFSTLELEFW